LEFLPLHDLSARHTGVTTAIGGSYTEAACVCLDRHHVSPVEISIEAPSRNCSAVAKWQRTDDRTRGAWANETDATETGAYGIALAAIEVAEGMVAVRRAETRTGADYYIAPVGASAEDLEAWLRLEVSGIDRGDSSLIQIRLRQKIRQALEGASNLPALATVVGFLAKCVMIARAEAS
jgi:hypothetical protein